MLNPWIVSAIIFFTIFLAKRSFLTSSKPYKNLPPSPPTFPILGNLHQLGPHPHRSLWRLAQSHGPVMLLRFGSRPVVVASSPDAAREIMKTQDIVFASRPKLTEAHKLLYQQRDISTSPYGEYWRQIRSICVFQLLSAKRIQSFRSIREEETALMVENIRVQCSMSSPVNLSQMLASLTNDIICRVSFGKKLYEGNDMKKGFMELLGELMRLLGSFSIGDYIPWLSWVNKINGLDAQIEKVAKAFDEFLDGVVDQHTEESNIKKNNNNNIKGDQDKKDLVDVLLEIQEDSKKGGFSIDRESIKAIILDMFVGGTDTTYMVLEWAMVELLRHPRILKKLQEEVTEITNGKPDIFESDLDKNTPYLNAIIKETLRLHPPISLIVPRESSQDAKIMGFDILAGTMVITNAWAIARDPSLWDEPEEFKPERFLNSAIDFKGSRNDQFHLIPFGAGRRGCPGVQFAMTIIELVLANIVQKFDWALPDGIKGEDLDMTERVGFTSHRTVPLLANAIPRL